MSQSFKTGQKHVLKPVISPTMETEPGINSPSAPGNESSHSMLPMNGSWHGHSSMRNPTAANNSNNNQPNSFGGKVLHSTWKGIYYISVQTVTFFSYILNQIKSSASYGYSSVPTSAFEQEPQFFSPQNMRIFWVYFCGAFFALGWWLYIDAIVATKKHDSDGIGLPVVGIEAGGIKFEDVICGVVATIGLIFMNLIGKESILEEYDMSPTIWQARVLFLVSVMLMIGGFGGSIAILIVKYTSKGYTSGIDVWFGASTVMQTLFILISGLTMWFVRNAESDPFL